MPGFRVRTVIMMDTLFNGTTHMMQMFVIIIHDVIMIPSSDKAQQIEQDDCFDNSEQTR